MHKWRSSRKSECTAESTYHVASICSKLAFDCPRLLSNSSEDPLRQNIKRPVTYEGVEENFDTTKLVEKKRLKKDHESKHANVSMPTLHDNDPSDGSQSSDSLNRVNESFDDSNDFDDGFVDGNTSDHSDEGFKNSMDKNFKSRDPDRKIVSITSDTEKDNIFDSNSKGDLENNSNMSQPVELNQRKVASATKVEADDIFDFESTCHPKVKEKSTELKSGYYSDDDEKTRGRKLMVNLMKK